MNNPTAIEKIFFNNYHGRVVLPLTQQEKQEIVEGCIVAFVEHCNLLGASLSTEFYSDDATVEGEMVHVEADDLSMWFDYADVEAYAFETAAEPEIMVKVDSGEITEKHLGA